MNTTPKRVASLKRNGKRQGEHGCQNICINVEIGLLSRLNDYCNETGQARARVIDDAVTEYLNGKRLDVSTKVIIPPPPVTTPVNYQEQP